MDSHQAQMNRRCVIEAHRLVDEVVSDHNFTTKKGVLIIRIPFNCGGIRTPQVYFDNLVDTTVTANGNIETVRREKM